MKRLLTGLFAGFLCIAGGYRIASGLHIQKAGITEAEADARYVNETGDRMTGQLTLYSSTLTVTGDAFSVGASTLVVKDGLLGVGLTDPAYIVDIKGESPRLRITPNGTTETVSAHLNNVGLSEIFLRVSGSGDASIFGETANTYGELSYNGGGATKSFYIGKVDAGLLKFGTNNTVKMTLDNSGRLGIGTTSPTAELFVVGNSTITQALYVSTIHLTGSAIFHNGYEILDESRNLTAFSISNEAGINLSALSLSTAAIQGEVNINTSQLVTVAVDTTTIAGNVATNTSDIGTNAAQLVTVAADTTTIAGNVSTNASDIGTNAAQLVTVAADTTTIAGNVATNASGISANATQLLAVAVDTTSIQSTLDTVSGTAVDNAANKVAKAGDTMTGDLIINGAELAIGLTAPDYALHVSGNESRTERDGGTHRFTIASYGGVPYLESRKTNGSKASPTAVTNGQTLLAINNIGHDGTGWSGAKARISVNAAQNWSNTAHGTRISWSVTENNTTTLTERIRLNADGNYGVGDTTPDARVEVSADGGSNDLLMLSSDDGNDGDLFVVKNDGKVGIGITNPSVEQHIYEAVVAAHLRVETGGSGQPAIFSAKAPDDGEGRIRFADASDDDAGELFYDHSTDELRIRVNASEAARFNSSGYLGIATTNPTEALYVVGNASFTGTVTADNFDTSGSEYRVGGVAFVDSGRNITGASVSNDTGVSLATLETSTESLRTDLTTVEGTANDAASEASANTAQLVTVAVDTTTIAGNVSTNASSISDNAAQLVTVAADTTTIAGNVSSNTSDISDNAAQLVTVAADTTTIAGNVSSNASDISDNATQLVSVAADTTTIAGNVSTNATDIGINAAQLLTVAVDTTAMQVDLTAVEGTANAALPKAGDTMSGDLDMGDNQLLNISSGVVNGRILFPTKSGTGTPPVKFGSDAGLSFDGTELHLINNNQAFFSLTNTYNLSRYNLVLSGDKVLSWLARASIYSPATDVLAFRDSSNQETVRIDDSGNVILGKGLTTASTWYATGNLDVAGKVDAAGFTEGASNTLSNDISGTAALADALSANGADAPSGYLCLGVDASGACEPALVDDTAGGVDASTSPASANVVYDVDTANVDIAGDTMTGDLNMGDNQLLNISTLTVNGRIALPTRGATTPAYVFSDSVYTGMGWDGSALQLTRAGSTGFSIASGYNRSLVDLYLSGDKKILWFGGTGTGIWSPSADNLRIQTLNTAAINIDDSQNVSVPNGDFTGMSDIILGDLTDGATLYMQIDAENGSPPAADCDADAESGRMLVDYLNNRVYVCNQKAGRGWDYFALTD